MAETTGSRFDIIKAIFRLGSGSKAQSCDGTFTLGNMPKYLADGALADSSIAAASVALIAKVQQEAYIYAADTGNANAYAVTLSPAPSIVAGSEVVFQAANANTGASTLSVNGTASPLTKNGTTALASGDISAGAIITAKRDSAGNWQMVAPSSSSGGGGASGTWVKEVPVGSLNGSNKTFTLTYTPIAGSLSLFLNIHQREGTDFTLSGNTITFAVAPKARDTGWFNARYQH